jgi:hypothetical protein
VERRRFGRNTGIPANGRPGDRFAIGAGLRASYLSDSRHMLSRSVVGVYEVMPRNVRV